MRSAKRRLRGELIARREALDVDRLSAARLAAAVFRPPVPAPRFVAAYRPMGGEFDPGPVLDRLAALGAVALLPVVVQKRGPLVFREAGDRTRHVPDLAGIDGPPPEAPARRPDLLLVPLLGFDAQGGRLGYGGGYYDRTLAALRQAGPRPLAVGLAFSGQEAANIPMASHDARLDAILTETGYRLFT